MRQIIELKSPTGKKKVGLYERDDGRYFFEEAYEDFDEIAGAYWTPGWQSGIYDDVQTAEAEMRSMTPWLLSAS